MRAPQEEVEEEFTALICLLACASQSRQRGQMNVCIKGSANMCTVYLSNTPPGGRYIGCWDLPGLICKHPVEAFEVVAPRMEPMHWFCLELELQLG